MFLRKKVKIDFHVDGHPEEDEVFLKCPVCGKVCKSKHDEEDGWDFLLKVLMTV